MSHLSRAISVVIITLNEEQIIERCIQSAKRITDDIIVIDSESTDNTVEIAKKLGARVFIEKWMGYGQNKNIGNQKARYDWILSIDADEVFDDSLVNELLHVKLKDNCIYSILNQLNFCGHWVKYTDWHPSYKKRLFNKNHTQWNTLDVHEGLISRADTIYHKLEGKILHYGYTSIDQLRSKTDQYAKLSAQHLFKANKQPSIIKLLFGPSFRFVKSYVIQLGFLDGKTGFIISLMNARLISWRHKYLNELKKG